jgi:hypothetical protein
MPERAKEQNRRTIERYVDAFNRGDLETLRGLFTPDTSIQGVLGWGGLEVARPGINCTRRSPSN